MVTKLVPLCNALRLPSAGHRSVGNPVEKDHTTVRYNHFLKSERDKEQATHVEVDHDTDYITSGLRSPASYKEHCCSHAALQLEIQRF